VIGSPDFKRNGRRQPQILLPDGSATVSYRSPSSVAKTLGDGGGLAYWKQAMTALGVMTSKSLQYEFSHIADCGGYDGSAKGQLYKAVQKAFVAGGGEEAAEIGTVVHSYTDLIDEGLPCNPPRELRPWFECYKRAVENLTLVGGEVRVVQDELKVAGTTDRFWQLPDGEVRCADTKTGSDQKYPDGVCLQVAMYSHSVEYHPLTDERSPLHKDLNPDVGLMIHLPVRDPGPPHCDIYELPLDQGWTRARLAIRALETEIKKLEKVSF
jgi:hypothetical protein